MENSSFGLSFLDEVVARMRRSDRSPLGYWRRSMHRLLNVIEQSRMLQGYCALWRGEGLPIEGVRSEPAIKLDSVFFFSLMAHVALLLLLAWVTVRAKPSINNVPIRVNIMEESGRKAATSKTISKRPARRRVKKKAVARQTPRPRAQPKKIVTKAVTEVKPVAKAPKALPKPKSIGPAVLPKPALPAPKMLASSPVGQALDVNAPEDPLVKLPTTEQSPAISASDLAVGDSSVSDVRADLAGIPKELMQGKGDLGRRTGQQSLQRADVGAYLKLIQERVKAVWRYPSGIRGVYEVNFSIVLDRAGKLVSVKLLSSSHSGLNSSATEAVKLAAPFPPMPQDLDWLAGQPIGLRFKVNLGMIR
jgi:TonB family protein